MSINLQELLPAGQESGPGSQSQAKSGFGCNSEQRVYLQSLCSWNYQCSWLKDRIKSSKKKEEMAVLKLNDGGHTRKRDRITSMRRSDSDQLDYLSMI